MLVLNVQGEKEHQTFLLGSSLDRLIRLFDIGTPYGNGQRRRGKEICSYFTGLENVISMTSDELSTTLPPSKSADDDEDVWANMAIAGDAKENNESEDESLIEKHPKRRRSVAP